MPKKIPICPNCRSKNVISIIYGLPTEDIGKEAEEGKVKLGGCCVTDNDPEWYCKDCEIEW